ncbi:MAG: Hg(II)-responsive transcriptional regulator [Idiomarinaceae bacterium]|uniref:Hg(II)-responsive transcriptional regulator n=1 Tax=Idiomarina sp. 28-8 TaxID=1260624 RepID=UPI0002D65DC2|nr:Hg(II)-responsive transcriptional regulator [Idiomarina sp. 28-8]NWO01422.1 Hg(II)-responsive transcriptional regulator [Idiomarinaceae bacterium]
MSEKQELMTIGTLAASAGVGVETVRYYQRRKLMAEPERPYGGIRYYGNHALQRLHFIRTSQWLGFSLDEIAELLKLQDGVHCDEARELGEQKLDSVRQKISHLQHIERALSGLVQQCSAQQGAVYCPLMASLSDGLQDVANVNLNNK